MIPHFDITNIESIRKQILSWLGVGKRFGCIQTSEGATYHGERFRIVMFGPGYNEPGMKYIDPDRHSLRLQLWTEKHSYWIVAHSLPAGGGKSYLGCVVDARAPRPGEEQTRGSDLADGTFSAETWLSILTDIVSYEAQPVHVPATSAAV